MVAEFKKVYIHNKRSEEIESMGTKDALQFPIMAGVMLVGLYMLIKFLGKEYVNYFILVYIALGSSTGIKSLLTSIFGSSLDFLDEGKLVDIKMKYLELEITPLDLLCLVLSFIQVGIYVWSKSWIYNNVLAIVFCVHAL